MHSKAYEPVIFHCTQALKVDQENAKVGPPLHPPGEVG